MGEYKNVPQEINNVVSDNLKKLAQLFPSVVKDGQLDIDALKEELGTFEEVGKEKYEFTWSGKQNAKKIAQQDVFGKTLKFCPEKSKNADTTENVYIEGDNLEALKLLRQNYYNSIKMIYIDPPYNTGNDFVYNDDYSMSQEESDIAEGIVDELGERYTKNVSGNRFHANWCNMIYPRLKLAKDLLTDDGVIFISIDDNEQENLRKACDEIFGTDNFIGQIVWQSTQKNDPRFIAINHEYVLCYTKNIGVQNLGGKWRTRHPLVNEMMNEYYKIKNKYSDVEAIQKEWNKVINKDKYSALKHYKFVDMKGPYFAADISDPQRKGPKHDFVIHPVTGKLCKAPAGGYSPREEEMRRRLANDEIHFGKTHEQVVCSKKYLTTAEDRLNSVYYEDGRRATKLVETLVGKGIFDHPQVGNNGKKTFWICN